MPGPIIALTIKTEAIMRVWMTTCLGAALFLSALPSPAMSQEAGSPSQSNQAAKPMSCPNQMVAIAGSNARLPISAIACTGFLAAYNKNQAALYESAAMVSLAEKMDKACRYKPAIDLGTRNLNARAAQIRIGRLQFENHYSAYENARAYPDYKAATLMLTTINNFHSTCSAMIASARASTQTAKPKR